MPNFPYLSEYTPAVNWRPLRLTESTRQFGWDVFDLQCKLAFAAEEGTVDEEWAVGALELQRDGIFTPDDEEVIAAYQDARDLANDGIAGVITQTTLGGEVCRKSGMPKRVLGQMSKESSLLCGIYTSKYENNGSRDRGPLQMNSRYHPNATAAFDVFECVPALVTRIKAQHRRYVESGVPNARAWAAAQGHWNSPVYADKYAKFQAVPQSFNDYVAAVTVYA